MLETSVPSNNSHESHDRADLWRKLLKYGIKPVDEEGVVTIYSGYNVDQLKKLLEEKETGEKQEEAA